MNIFILCFAKHCVAAECQKSAAYKEHLQKELLYNYLTKIPQQID